MTSKDETIETLAKLVAGFQIHTRTQIDKIVFAEGVRDEAEAFLRAGGDISEALETFDNEYLGQEVEERNLFLNEGLNDIFNKVVGTLGTAFNNANARVGTGTSTTAAVATQTGLLAGAVFKAMDATYPLGAGSNQNVDFRGTYGSADANQIWSEFTVDNGSGPNINLHRTVSAQGTKVSGQTWVLTITLSPT